MVLELIAIGGVVYYYVRKNKLKYVPSTPSLRNPPLTHPSKAKQAAFAAGQPWVNKDGTLTYPPNHPGLPPYTPKATNTPSMGDYKRQTPQSNVRSVSVPIEGREEYRDEKAPLVVQTREAMNDKY